MHVEWRYGVAWMGDVGLLLGVVPLLVACVETVSPRTALSTPRRRIGVV